MTKLAIIPFTVLLQTLFYSKSFSLPTKLALVILLMVRIARLVPRRSHSHSCCGDLPLCPNLPTPFTCGTSCN